MMRPLNWAMVSLSNEGCPPTMTPVDSTMKFTVTVTGVPGAPPVTTPSSSKSRWIVASTVEASWL